jgi:hypothetical protein
MSDSTSPAPLPAPGSDPNATPNLTVAPPAPRRRTPFRLNGVQMHELNLALAIAQQAQKPEYASLLDRHAIPATFVTTLLADIQTAHQRSGEAVASTADKESATSDGTLAKRTLVASLRQAQAAAKQKHLFDDPARLDAYLVGERIAQNRAMLEQASQVILSRADAERPSGVDTGFIERVRGERTAFVATKVTQRDEVAQAKTQRLQRDGLVNSIKQRRIQIQLAADAAWPASVPANGPLRQKFLLPPNRAFNARGRARRAS